MKLLFGIKGGDTKKYHAQVRESLSRLDIDDDKLIMINESDDPIKLPAIIHAHGKSLLINGTVIWRTHTLDDYLANPVRLLQELLKKDVPRIPLEFVNGAYNGVLLERDELWLFNDFMALDPLYYACVNETLFFSNRLQFLNHILRRPWDSRAVNEYLASGYNFSYQTIYSGIYCLPPASILSMKQGKVTVSRYASFPKDPEILANEKDIIKDVHREFALAIKRLYSPKLKNKLSLTGGMDSRLIYFEWPERNKLLTETAGEGTSDYLKARELTRELGDPALHQLEDLHEEQYLDGIHKFYQECDNPTKLLDEYNYHHLAWKRNRGANLHMSGVGGELLNGESLYLSRKPLQVLREAFLPYVYKEVRDEYKHELIEKVLYSRYKITTLSLLDDDHRGDINDHFREIADLLDTFLGKPRFMQTYIERFRTFMLANASFYPLNVPDGGGDFLLMPYNDRDLINTVCRYHPKYRELRHLELALIKRYDLASHIPLDSSHLMQNRPYIAHKFMRTVRMVFNIGLHKKVPFFQKGEPPRFRAFKYFDHSAGEFREYIKTTILSSQFFDKKLLAEFFAKIDRVNKFNFYTNHREATNLMLLFRLAWMDKKKDVR